MLHCIFFRKKKRLELNLVLDRTPNNYTYRCSLSIPAPSFSKAPRLVPPKVITPSSGILRTILALIDRTISQAMYVPFVSSQGALALEITSTPLDTTPRRFMYFKMSALPMSELPKIVMLFKGAWTNLSCRSQEKLREQCQHAMGDDAFGIAILPSVEMGIGGSDTTVGARSGPMDC
jgi:hypothetical protein